jgi:hypothetical protein
MSTGSVRIHYRRLPDREQLFEQAVLEDAGEYVVTFLEAAQLPRPVMAGGRVVLEPGAPVVWTTYRGDVWHDVGRFHLADGTFTGFYANVLTPVAMSGDRWDTTDLALDVWAGADGAAAGWTPPRRPAPAPRPPPWPAPPALAIGRRSTCGRGTWPAPARTTPGAPDGAAPSDHTQRETP